MEDSFEVNIWSPKESAPPEVKAFAKHSGELPSAVYERLKKGALRAVCGKQMTPALWKKLELDCTLAAKKAGKEVKSESLVTCYAGLLTMFQALFKVSPPKLKPVHVQSGLEGLKLADDLKKDLEETVFSEVGDQIRDMLKSSVGSSLCTIESTAWAVDGILSTSVISGVMQPLVKIRLRMSDGSTQQMMLDVARFQKLRYAVASTLREMNEWENKALIRT